MDPFSLILSIAGVGSAILFGAWQIYLSYRQIKLQQQQQINPAAFSLSKLPEQPIQKTLSLPAQSGVKLERRWSDILKFVLMSEIPKQLRSINIFDRASVIGNIKRIYDNPSFSERIPSKSLLGSGIDKVLSTSSQLGILNEKIEIEKYLRDQNHPIHIAFPPIMLATSAIFIYLRDIKHYNLRLHYKFAHAIELVGNIRRRHIKPDGCVIGDAVAVQLLNNETKSIYQFSMLMPRMEQRIVTAKVNDQKYTSKNMREGTYCFIKNEISTPLFEFEHLERTGRINKKRISIEDLEPHESVSILKEGNVEKRLILWTPHWQIYQLLGIGMILDSPQGSGYWFDTMLFFGQSFLKQFHGKRAEMLLVAIRDAWLVLHDQRSLEITVEKLLSDAEYVEVLKRYCGLHQLDIF